MREIIKQTTSKECRKGIGPNRCHRAILSSNKCPRDLCAFIGVNFTVHVTLNMFYSYEFFRSPPSVSLQTDSKSSIVSVSSTVSAVYTTSQPPDTKHGTIQFYWSNQIVELGHFEYHVHPTSPRTRVVSHFLAFAEFECRCHWGGRGFRSSRISIRACMSSLHMFWRSDKLSLTSAVLPACRDR